MRGARGRLPALARVLLLPALSVPLAAGCMQVETRVKLNPDMTATVTERVRFSRRLLDLAGDRKGELLKLLSKESALKRMKKMGAGISLSSHRLRDAEGASKESLTVFKLKKLDDFKYVSPWPGYSTWPENHVIKCKVEAILRNRDVYNEKPGDMAVSFLHLKRPPRVPSVRELTEPRKGEKPRKEPAPLELQMYRELGPVFRDMLKGFQVRFTFESYAPVLSRLGVRDKRAGARGVDLINFSDKNLDTWGGRFLENEELMLDLVRWELDSVDIGRHVTGFAGNRTLPVYLRRGGHGTRICFRPSRAFFDKYMAGKTLSSPWWRGRTEKADFAKIGWRPRKTKKKPDPRPKPAPKRGAKGEKK